MAETVKTPKAAAPTADAAGGAPARNQRRTLVGTVVSTKMQKTITVQVERTFKHAKYGKYLRKRKGYHAHNPGTPVKDGDRVEIAATRPISKLVRWRLVRVVTAAVERGADVKELGGAS